VVKGLDRALKKKIVSEARFLRANRIPTGSAAMDSILGGGLPRSCLTDIFGAAGTGKTQLAFQCALMACTMDELAKSPEDLDTGERRPRVVFVDCLDSFRPERIAEIARARQLSNRENEILDSIYSIKAGTVAAQKRASERFSTEDRFSHCVLLIVDNVTSNFTSEASTDEEGIIRRQFELSMYSRRLAYLANKKNIAVMTTNSTRAAPDQGEEREATGEILSMYSLFRIHFEKRRDGLRMAHVVQPFTEHENTTFEITSGGIP
jgi:RecA/RadA recombinase